MIDIIQWRVSIGLWNCCQSAAGPIRRGCRSIKTDSPNGKKKTRSLVLSLITVLLFVLTLISGYLELKYNPPLRGIIIHCSWSRVHCTDTVTDNNWLQSVALESDTVYPPPHLRLLLLLSGDVELNPGPTIIFNVKEPPPLPSLIDLLDELDNWKEFASRLDGITTKIIKEIEEKQDDVDSQKKALFEKWIEVCPNCSWRHVVVALKDCGENDLADEIIDNMLKGIRGYVFPISLIDVISTIFYIVFDAITDADNLISQRIVDSINKDHRSSDDDKSSSLVAYLNNEFNEPARNQRRYLNKVCHVLINQQYQPLTEIVTTMLEPFGMSVPKVSVQPDEFCSFFDSMKSQYKRQSIINTKSPFSSQTVEFAILSMIENADQVMLSQFMSRGQVDKILETPGVKRVNVEDIIDSSLPLKVMIDGPPGIGKTTLCRKLLNMWSNGTHKHFDLVLYCPLGNSKIAKAKDLADIFLFDSSKVSKVVKWMSDGDGKGLLIIFDGWDELSTELRQSSLATSIIHGEKLKQCSVIITSCSYASSSLLDMSIRHIQVIGFTEAEVTAVIIRALIRDEQIAQELIDKKREDEKNGRFFTPIQSRAYDEAIAVKLINYLEIRKNLRLLCCVPLICFVVIKVYESKRPTTEQDLSGRLTPFYEHIILEIIEKHLPEHECHSLSLLPTVLVESFKKLCQLAYSNIPNKGIPQEHVQSQLSEKDYFLMNLFTNYYNGKYQFLHLSIQEFLAAWWIAKHEEKTEEVFNRHFDDNNFRMCLKFVAGLTGLKHDSYNQYFNEQLDLQCERVPAFGLKAQYSQLPSNCQIISVDSTMSEKFSMLLQFLYESGNTNLRQLLAESIKNRSLCLNRVSLSLFDCLCLKYLLQVSGHKWNHLHLGKLNDQMLSLLHGSGGSVIQCKMIEVLLFQPHHYTILPTIYLTGTRECYIVIKGGQYNPFHELSSLFGGKIKELHLTMSQPDVLSYFKNSAHSLEERILTNSSIKEVDLKFNGQVDGRIITSIIKGVARNETMHSFSLTVTSLDHPIPVGIIEDLLESNDTLQALSLNMPDELLPTPLNIAEVNTPLIELELCSALMISLLQHIKGLNSLILHEQYLPHLIFHSHTHSLPIDEKANELSKILRNCTSLKALKVVVLNMNELFANDALCKSLEVMFKQNQTLQSFELASEGSLYNHVPVSVLSSLITGINNSTSIENLSVPIPLSTANSQLVKRLFEIISQKEALTQCHIDLRPDESYQSYSDNEKKQKMKALYEELKPPEFVKSSHVTIKLLGMEFEDLVNSNHEISSCSGLITEEDLKLALEEGSLKYCVSSAFIQGEAHGYVKSAILSLPHNEAIKAPQVSFNSFSINCYGSTNGECWKLISSDEMDEKIIAEIQERAHKIADTRYSESNVPPKTSRQFDALGVGDNVKIASDESASEEMAMSPNFDPLKFCKKRCHGRFGDYKEWIQIINSDGVQIQFQKLLFALMPCTTDVHLVNASKNLSEPSTSLQLQKIECETSHFQSLSTNTQSKKLLVISVGTHSEKVPLLTNIESSEEKSKPFNVSDYAENLFKLCETEAERVDRQSKRITKLLRKGAYEVEVPLKWHYFGVILRKEAVKSNGVLTKSSCVEYGKSLDMSVEDVDKALKSLHMSKMLLYYHDSPAKDIVFVKLDSLINIIQELVDDVLKYRQTSEEISHQLRLLATKGYLSVATLKSCKAVQAIAEGVYDKNYSVCYDKILEVFQYVNIAAKISKGRFFMPAILPVRNVSDPRNPRTKIPLCFYSNNFRVPMGSYCAVVIHLLSADAENRWQITSDDVHFFKYFTLQKTNGNEQDLKIVIVEQLSWIEIYCEEISDVRIKVREEIEEVICVVMDENFEPGFKCPCGAKGDDHIAKFRLKDSFAIICTLNEKEQKLSENDLDHYCSWFMDQEKIKDIKRRRRKDNHLKERNNESDCASFIGLDIEDKECKIGHLMKIFNSSAHHYGLIGTGLGVNIADLHPLPTMTTTNLTMVFQRCIDSGNATWKKMLKLCDDFPEQLGKAKKEIKTFLSSKEAHEEYKAK